MLAMQKHKVIFALRKMNHFFEEKMLSIPITSRTKTN